MDERGMTLDEAAGREHAPGRLDAAELHVERNEPRAIHRGTGGDALPLELARAATQLLEPLGSLCAIRFVQVRLYRTGGRHAGAIRGDARVFKRCAARPIA